MHRYVELIGHLKTALGLLLNAANQAEVSVPQGLVTNSRGVFHEWPTSPGEWANLFRLTKRYAKSKGVLPAARWLCSPKKGLTAAGLLSAHLALIAHQAGRDEEAATRLADSARLLARIALTPAPLPVGDFATRWLALGRAWGQFWLEYFRLGDARYRARLDFVTQWEDG